MIIVKKIVLKIIALFLFAAFSKYGFATPGLPPAIFLPPTDTLQQQLSFLAWLYEEIPAAQEQDVTFNVNLREVILDNAELVAQLMETDGYVDAFKGRKHIRITVNPIKEKIKIASKRIASKALKTWQGQLLEALHSFESTQPLPQAIADRLTDITTKLQEYENYLEERDQVKPLWPPFLERNNLIKLLGLSKNQEETNAKKTAFFDELNKKNSTSERLKHVHETLETRNPQAKEEIKKLIEVINRTKLFESKKTRYDKIKETTQLQIKEQCVLTELYGLLHKKANGFEKSKGDENEKRNAESIIKSLQVNDLLLFEDKEFTQEFIEPLSTRMQEAKIVTKTTIQDELNIEYEMHRAQKNLLYHIKNFTQQTRMYESQVTNQITLQEVPPRLGIFRGLINGDCSTKYSFPYPNDPSERVFWIRDADNKIKGSVSTTVVDITDQQGQKSKGLYVITVAGPTVTTEDTELVFRALDREKHLFGAHHLLLPQMNKIENLINFSDIRGAYNARINHQIESLTAEKSVKQREIAEKSLTVDIKYGAYRPKIEDFKADKYDGTYDKQSSNEKAIVLKYPDEDLSDDILTIQSISVEPTVVNLEPISKKKIILLALNEYAKGRHDVVDTLNQDELLSTKERNELEHALQALKNKTGRDIKAYEIEVESALALLGISKKDIELHQSLLYYGRLKCPDAFSEIEIEKTAQDLTRDIELHEFKPQAGWEIITNNLKYLKKTKAFHDFHKKLIKFFLSSDGEMANIAANILLNIIPNLESIDSHYALVFEHIYATSSPSIVTIALIRAKTEKQAGAHWSRVKNQTNDLWDKKIKDLEKLKPRNFLQAIDDLLTIDHFGLHNEARQILKNVFDAIQNDINLLKSGHVSTYHLFGKGADALLSTDKVMTPKQRELCEEWMLLNCKKSKENDSSEFTNDFCFAELKHIRTKSIRDKFIQVLIEFNQKKIQGEHLENIPAWISARDFCDETTKLEPELAKQFSAFCSTVTGKYTLTQKIFTDKEEHIVDIAHHFCSDKSRARWPKSAAMVEAALNDLATKEHPPLGRAVRLLRAYGSNLQQIPDAATRIAIIQKHIESNPKSDMHSPHEWMRVAEYFEPEWELRTELMKTIENALLSILETEEKFDPHAWINFNALHWSKKYTKSAIRKILTTSDKEEKKKLIKNFSPATEIAD